MKNYLDVLKTVRLFKGIEEADLQPLLSCLCCKIGSLRKRANRIFQRRKHRKIRHRSIGTGSGCAG
jgi:hypothetical protein